jgi:2,2-dialkylglycine decarboxylase (pyruvate)
VGSDPPPRVLLVIGTTRPAQSPAGVDDRASLLIRYGGDIVEGLVARASGSFVETVDGQRVLDFTAGQICATVGHNHPRVVAASRG